ncbi:unnamed protein product [Arabidopsis halleri]
MLVFSSLFKPRRQCSACVFWDVVDCPIPEGHNVREASGNIIKARESSGYNGAVSIRAYYGDMNQTMVDVKEPVKELSCVPAGEDKDLRLEMLLVDFLCWIISHPAPATYMLIVGDISEHKEFIKAFVRFEKQGYTCLLAQPQISSVMKSYGKTNWLWKSLSSGGSPLDEDQSESSQLVDSTSVGSGSS